MVGYICILWVAPIYIVWVAETDAYQTGDRIVDYVGRGTDCQVADLLTTKLCNRMLCHNGEINTLKGNANWMGARESVISSPKLGAELTQQMLPVIDKSQSDSGSYDNVLEFLYHGSHRSLPECMLMMIPEPWQNDGNIDEDTKAFYRFYSNVMEPWDGPAMIAFTNGDIIGATLDRTEASPVALLRDG